MTVVIDCNILVICLTSRSPYHNIYKAIVAGDFILAVTTDIILEYEEVIEKKYGPATSNAFIALLNELPNVRVFTTYYHWQLITTDPDDNKYCDCAVAGQADFIVTEDRHFDILEKILFPKLVAIPIEVFSAMFK